jgi:hypothetical protein
MEVLMGMPPPPPPPGVPDLEETADSKDGRRLTTRERMELHRTTHARRVINTWIRLVSPRQLRRHRQVALQENGTARYPREMMTGRAVTTPMDLTRSLFRPVPLARVHGEPDGVRRRSPRRGPISQPSAPSSVRRRQGCKMWSFIRRSKSPGSSRRGGTSPASRRL